MPAALLALQTAPAPLPPPAADVGGAAAALPVVAAVILLAVLGLWLGRRALRAAGVRAERRTRSAAEREAAFMAMTLAMHEASMRRRPSLAAAAAEPEPPSARPAPGAFGGQVFCPACGASLGAAGAMVRFVTKCPGCARRVAARADGLRVSVDVDFDGGGR